MTAEQFDFFQANGYVKIEAAFSPEEQQEIAACVKEISNLPQSPDKWLHHYEKLSDTGASRLARTENILSYSTGLGRLLMAGKVPGYVSSALGEDVFLYKEKINYKYPGGAGYRAHQDAPAYKQLSNHATCLISIDESDSQNGCLEFAAGRHNEGLLGLTDKGVISKEVEAELEFTPCPTQPGDIVVFSSYIPHRSTANHSDRPRNVMYLTYNSQAEGYLRDEYYRHKRETMAEGQLSLIQHFEGEVQPGHQAIDDIRQLFDVAGDTMYDPVVTQQEHALQSAALAEADGASDALVAAALLHDVGHLLLDEHAANADFLIGDKEHETVGAEFLEMHFPPQVTEPIRLHVPAKRYLCTSVPGYWEALSEASKRSLEVQGGQFGDDEAADFIGRDHAAEAARLRQWDDRAKSANVATPSLEHFLDGAVARSLRK